ncbi:MAG: hypothetical protein IJV33_08155 [Bacteroidaceae bacterium]|nr:hypothetical protein [Bacteroidaceae bacterium]
MKLNRYHCATLLLSALLMVSCSVIDDDRSDCGDDSNNFQLDYELQLVTNITTELQTELSTQTDVSVATALRGYLSDIFTDFAHDIDLSFYDTQDDSIRLQHDQHVMDANQASYALNLPMRQYMHLAAANLVENPIVSLVTGEHCHTAKFLQPTADTITSHTTGVFSARLPMDVQEGISQHFNVHLYMTNCATALVIDTIGSGIRNLKVFTTGFAVGFNLADSTYIYSDTPPIVTANAINTNANTPQVFCSVQFPSRETQPTRTIIETTDPFVSTAADESLWEYRIYATTAEGTETETIFHINTPQRAGQLKVLKAKAHADGAVSTNDPTVGVNVTTNWNNGGQYNPEL